MFFCFGGPFPKLWGGGKTLNTWNYPRISKLHLILPHELTEHELTLRLVIQLNSSSLKWKM